MKTLLTLAGIGLLLLACKSKTATYTVQSRTLNEAVYASGEIMPEAYYFLKANSADLLLKVPVKEGDNVKQNEILAVLGTPSQLEQVDILHRQVALAGSNAQAGSAALTELKNRIALAKTQQEQDALNADRYTELAKSKAVSEKDAEQARVQAASSATQYKTLQDQYKSLQNDLSGKLLQAQQQLAATSQSREGKVLKSPVDGRVYKVYLKTGELAQLNDPIVMVGIPGRFKLELLVDERDISKIRLDQKVYFETDVYKGKQFVATVNKIIPLLQKESRSFQVEAAVQDTALFYPQSSVEANIVVRERVTGLVVPSDYLMKGDSVYLQQGKELHKTAVVTGIRSGDWVEIKSGLKAGDVVAIKEGR
ncbi:efflux RND transporter periplasmic adaptor subunit [Chitinophaga qingshengii]|uniref:HlyD family efflux transporter periplasmic adaptor subunit n=1 Tax=Chitinophaga qingshengii TaxID=1569794 RepID=A0ABR7TT44_9BACT|nr:HlyD family efflux transporter periplasmic adaptor subunit [Chitinophaga qingshengii]MBC9933210.1 HlyD family efflux transporter periplasmic adaptor subunit [Chitinophaga qingshengii]